MSVGSSICANRIRPATAVVACTVVDRCAVLVAAAWGVVVCEARTGVGSRPCRLACGIRPATTVVGQTGINRSASFAVRVQVIVSLARARVRSGPGVDTVLCAPAVAGCTVVDRCAAHLIVANKLAGVSSTAAAVVCDTEVSYSNIINGSNEDV